MTEQEAIQTLMNSQLLDLWEKNGACSDPSSLGMREIGNALQVIKPSYHIDWACYNCLKNMLNEAVRVKNEGKLKFYKFPKED